MKPSLKHLQKTARVILDSALQAVHAGELIRKNVLVKNHRLHIDGSVYDLRSFRSVYVVGAGKAVAPMAEALERLLGDFLSGGLIITKYGHTRPLQKIQCLEAGHPFPDANGVNAMQSMIETLDRTGSKDLVIGLFTGGGSALMTCPLPGITLAQEQKITRLLYGCGAKIEEINQIRCRLSRVKGGKLLNAIQPARSLNLILSDVIGDPLHWIAGGPTVLPPKQTDSPWEVIRKYRLVSKVPLSIRKLLQWMPGNNIRSSRVPVKNVLIGNNGVALSAAAETARQLGYTPLILTRSLSGEAREVAAVLASIAREAQATGQPISPPACILSGGETTVTVVGKGSGGRNQELALSAAIHLRSVPGTVLISCGTDGTDGFTPATGAMVHGKSCEQAKKKNLSPEQFLANNDSYHFFQALGGAIETGPTGTNVMDLQIMVLGAAL